MNTGKLCLAIGSLAVLNLPLGLPAQAGPTTVLSTPGTTAPSSKGTPAAGLEVIEATEKLRLVTAGYKAGANTPSDLNEATIALANAQLRSAVSLDNTKAIQQALATIVVQRQQLLRFIQAEYAEGIVDTDIMTQAQTALALAMVRVDLYSLVSLRKQSLSQAQIRNRSGAEAPQKLTEAQDAYWVAQRLFSGSGEGSQPTF